MEIFNFFQKNIFEFVEFCLYTLRIFGGKNKYGIDIWNLDFSLVIVKVLKRRKEKEILNFLKKEKFSWQSRRRSTLENENKFW